MQVSCASETERTKKKTASGSFSVSESVRIFLPCRDMPLFGKQAVRSASCRTPNHFIKSRFRPKSRESDSRNTLGHLSAGAARYGIVRCLAYAAVAHGLGHMVRCIRWTGVCMKRTLVASCVSPTRSGEDGGRRISLESEILRS